MASNTIPSRKAMLNSSRWIAITLDPKQLAWLEKELANAGTDWKICFFTILCIPPADFTAPRWNSVQYWNLYF